MLGRALQFGNFALLKECGGFSSLKIYKHLTPSGIPMIINNSAKPTACVAAKV